VRIHVREHPELMERFGANWTPTILVLDSEGVERHRIEGFLPADDFAAQLVLGLGHMAFALGDYAEAEKRFDQELRDYPATDSAAEAQYWKGVSRYKRTGNSAELTATYRAFQERYGNTPWAKKASVWAPTAA
jgi:outer membrane protein assembly factor BamD (BamD/ComL family)